MPPHLPKQYSETEYVSPLRDLSPPHRLWRHEGCSAQRALQQLAALVAFLPQELALGRLLSTCRPWQLADPSHRHPYGLCHTAAPIACLVIGQKGAAPGGRQPKVCHPRSAIQPQQHILGGQITVHHWRALGVAVLQGSSYVLCQLQPQAVLWPPVLAVQPVVQAVRRQLL